jgi:Mg2+ and Co2+ transporter CorA
MEGLKGMNIATGRHWSHLFSRALVLLAAFAVICLPVPAPAAQD